MAQALKTDPALKLEIGGHTENVGTLASNAAARLGAKGGQQSNGPRPARR